MLTYEELLIELEKAKNLQANSDNAVDEVIWLYELELGQGIYQGCKGENAEKDIHVVANSFENSGKPFKTYLHPPLEK